MSRSPLVVVCDAGPLIHLDELGCLDLLADFGTVLVPEQVGREVEHHRPGALERSELHAQEVPVVISDDAAFQALVRALAGSTGWSHFGIPRSGTGGRSLCRRADHVHHL
jgi:hypothetical protein